MKQYGVGESLTTVGGLTRHFHDVYGLRDGKYGMSVVKHDALHVMTGYGLSLWDEEGLQVCDKVIHNREDQADAAAEYFFRLEYTRATTHGGRLADTNDVYPSLLKSPAVMRAQRGAETMSKEERRALMVLACEMRERLHDAIGYMYANASESEVRSLAFVDLDFTARAQEIKQALISRRNRDVEEKTAQALHEESMKRRNQPMPRAFSPWHGPGLKLFDLEKKL